MSLGNPGRFSSHDNDKRLDSGPHPVSLSVLHFPCNVNGNRSFLTSHEVASSDFASCHPSTIIIRYSFTYNCRYDMRTITDKYPRYELLGINQSPISQSSSPIAHYQSNWRIYRMSQKEVVFRILFAFLKATCFRSCPIIISGQIL